MTEKEVSNQLYMLTTLDNPFDPFTQYDEWDAYDTEQGYHTSAFLARIVRTSEDLSEAQQRQDTLNAIDEIIQENILGIYTRAYKKEEVLES